jgi:hypothetical protein
MYRASAPPDVPIVRADGSLRCEATPIFMPAIIDRPSPLPLCPRCYHCAPDVRCAPGGLRYASDFLAIAIDAGVPGLRDCLAINFTDARSLKMLKESLPMPPTCLRYAGALLDMWLACPLRPRKIRANFVGMPLESCKSKPATPTLSPAYANPAPGIRRVDPGVRDYDHRAMCLILLIVMLHLPGIYIHTPHAPPLGVFARVHTVAETSNMDILNIDILNMDILKFDIYIRCIYYYFYKNLVFDIYIFGV